MKFLLNSWNLSSRLKLAHIPHGGGLQKELLTTFQLRFPTAREVEELSFFTGMQLRIVPDVFIKVEKWNSNSGAKVAMSTAWFRIRGIPFEKRSEQNVCLIASLVGLPLEVDKSCLKKFDYVRVKIGNKHITKVPAVVEGMLDFFFYDFEFQREVPQEGITNPAGNKWVRVDKPVGEHPSPKKPRFGEHPSREVLVLVDLVTQVVTVEVLLWAHQRKMHSYKNLRIAYLSQLKRTSRKSCPVVRMKVKTGG